MQCLSVKDLHTKFPFVKSELKKGTSFLVICDSQPIGELRPLANGNGNGNNNYVVEKPDEEFKDMEQIAIQQWERDIPPLTKAEYDYYMSLPKYKE